MKADDFFTLSLEAACLAERHMSTHQLPAKSALHKLPLQRVQCLSSWGKCEIEVSKVQTPQGKFWADRKTGTLYRLGTGECLTSSSMRIAL